MSDIYHYITETPGQLNSFNARDKSDKSKSLWAIPVIRYVSLHISLNHDKMIK